ncbi:hypothetical protein [Risungbinella massiliensis]|uniref:hypothetical protein n=1 Tax=Risungbinella massiliensis TaxID=1329796 RepID=UPI0005CC335B|nr:hypothetical protein [Risungbinella massiliensis]
MYVKGTITLSGNGGKKVLPSELDNLLEVACSHFSGCTIEFHQDNITVFVGLQEGEDLMKFQKMREQLGNPPAKVGKFNVETADVLAKAKNTQTAGNIVIFLPKYNNVGELFSNQVYQDILEFIKKECKLVPSIGTEKTIGAWMDEGVIYYDEHQKVSISNTSDYSTIEKIAKYAGEKLNQLAMFVDYGDTFSIIDTDPVPYQG